MHRSGEVYMAIHGEITPPPDKSISHRAFILGALAKGVTTVRNALESEDIKSTRSALSTLGVDNKRKEIYTGYRDHRLRNRCRSSMPVIQAQRPGSCVASLQASTA